MAFRDVRGSMKGMVLEHVTGKCMSTSELIGELDLGRLVEHVPSGEVHAAVRELEKEGKVSSYWIKFSSNGASFGFYDIFDSSKAKPCKLIYSPGMDGEVLLGFKIATLLKDGLLNGQKSSIHYRFSTSLPRTAYRTLKKYV